MSGELCLIDRCSHTCAHGETRACLPSAGDRRGELCAGWVFPPRPPPARWQIQPRRVLGPAALCRRQWCGAAGSCAAAKASTHTRRMRAQQQGTRTHTHTRIRHVLLPMCALCWLWQGSGLCPLLRCCAISAAGLATHRRCCCTARWRRTSTSLDTACTRSVTGGERRGECVLE